MTKTSIYHNVTQDIRREDYAMEGINKQVVRTEAQTTGRVYGKMPKGNSANDDGRHYQCK